MQSRSKLNSFEHNIRAFFLVAEKYVAERNVAQSLELLKADERRDL